MAPHRRLQAAAAALLLLSLACSLLRPAASPTPGSATPTPPRGAYPLPFADYVESAVRLPSTYTGYSLPLDLTRVQGMQDSPLALTPAQSALLAQNGFVVTPPKPGEYREFYQIYEDGRYAQLPAFITTDSVLHVYHLLFDKILRDLETERFLPALKELTTAMMAASLEQLNSLGGKPLAEPAKRNVAFFAVASRLLGMETSVPPDVGAMVESELGLIEAHAGPAVSPIWDRTDLPDDQKLIEDYSQYVPRGHYTRSEDLKRYFKAMMWYGRLTYRLRDPFETQRALLVTQALRTAPATGGRSALKLWESIFEPTVFLVGKADDLSYFEYGALSDSVFGLGAPPSAFGDGALLQAFMEAAKQLPPPQVNSMWVWINEDKEQATKGFRFMGQRFTLDAYVFGQLIWRNVGTDAQPRGLPKALDFFAALGSKEALDILDAMGETAFANYPARMTKVRKEIAALQLDSWTQNVYWSWLYALQPVIEVKDARYPEFMRTQAWTRKDLHTALGSFTELKHDTILYAKQVMAEMGGGMPEVPKGFVEPNPEAFARLQALAEMTRNGLISRMLLSDTMGASLENLIDLLTFLKSAAEKELNRQALSQDDYMRITYFGGEIEALTLAAADCDQPGPACRNLQDQKAALVADIATGLAPDIPGLAALEEGDGQPTHVVVVLPDQPLRLAYGAVYTYYEFVVPVDQRMTDEAWQAQVEAGTLPAPPDWTRLFITP